MPTSDKYHLFEREIDSWRIRNKASSERKSYDEVFDQQNLMRMYKLISDGVIDRLDFPISTGKEGNVFRASTKDGQLLAVKIYRTSTSTFTDMGRYIQGDPRFKGLPNSRRKLILAWAEKEFMNLGLLHRAGVRVPKPVARHANIIVMEYIGDESGPARQLRSGEAADPAAVAEGAPHHAKLAYQKAKLVHCDLSEYNVLMLGQEPVVIDVGQGVLRSHPNAPEWLERDVRNVARYFKRYGLKIDVAEQIKEITKE